MDFESKYNTKIPAVKRLMREAYELREDTEDYSAHPLQDNLFEWHFTVKGASGTEFEGGVYHGRIVFPNEYPMKPPNIILLTPNGRFETNKKICLSISGHHPETWQPSWSIRTALLALIAFMPTEAKGTIGSLDYTEDERKVLARKSQNWQCNECGLVKNLLGQSSASVSAAESQMIKSVMFKEEAGGSSGAGVSRPSPTPAPAAASPPESPAEPAQAPASTLPSGFYLEPRTADLLASLIILVLAFLLYRRFG